MLPFGNLKTFTCTEGRSPANVCLLMEGVSCASQYQTSRKMSLFCCFGKLEMWGKNREIMTPRDGFARIRGFGRDYVT